MRVTKAQFDALMAGAPGKPARRRAAKEDHTRLLDGGEIANGGTRQSPSAPP